MKCLITFFAMMVLSYTAYADQSIKLQPGSSMTIEAGVTTIVTCQGSTGPKLMDKYCKCDVGSLLVKLNLVHILQDGRTNKYELSQHNSPALCEEYKTIEPACKAN